MRLIMHLGHLGRLALGAVLGLGACTYPEKELVAQGPPFACYNKPLPSTAAERVTIAGTLQDPFDGKKLTGTAVEVFLVGTAVPIFTATSDGNGAFSHDQGTGGAPRDAYLRAAPNGYLPTYFYPAVPISGNITATLQLLTAMDVATIGAVAGITVDTTKANFLVSVIDCNGDAIAGATISTNPPGKVTYFANATPSPVAVATDAMTGSALVSSVAVSNTTINATVSGMTLRSHNLDGVAGAIMQTEIQP